MSTALDLSRADDDSLDGTARLILDAALQLYLEFGLRRTTMDDVARRVGIGRVTIYRHYPDKSVLFQAVVLRECARALRQIERQVASIAPLEQRLIEAFVLVVDGARHHPLIRRLLATEPEWLLPYLTVKADVILRLGVSYGAGYIRLAQAQGFLTRLDADITAELLIRMVQSLTLTPGGLLAPDSAGELRALLQKILPPLLKP